MAAAATTTPTTTNSSSSAAAATTTATAPPAPAPAASCSHSCMMGGWEVALAGAVGARRWFAALAALKPLLPDIPGQRGLLENLKHKTKTCESAEKHENWTKICMRSIGHRGSFCSPPAVDITTHEPVAAFGDVKGVGIREGHLGTARQRQCLSHEGSGNTRQRRCRKTLKDSERTANRQWKHEREGSVLPRGCRETRHVPR